MMDTAAPEGAFKMTNVHCKLLVLISKYGQMPVADEQKLISALKISSEDLQSVTAFQVGEYGRKLMT